MRARLALPGRVAGDVYVLNPFSPARTSKLKPTGSCAVLCAESPQHVDERGFKRLYSQFRKQQLDEDWNRLFELDDNGNWDPRDGSLDGSSDGSSPPTPTAAAVIGVGGDTADGDVVKMPAAAFAVAASQQLAEVVMPKSSQPASLHIADRTPTRVVRRAGDVVYDDNALAQEEEAISHQAMQALMPATQDSEKRGSPRLDEIGKQESWDDYDEEFWAAFDDHVALENADAIHAMKIDDPRVATNSCGVFTTKNPMRRLAWAIYHSHAFHNMILVVIFLNIFMMAVATKKQLADKEFLYWYTITDVIVTIIFTIEVVVGMLSNGVYGDQFSFLRSSNWNRLDLFIVVTSWLELIEISWIQLQALRAFKVLRVVRSLYFFGGIRVIVTALMDSIPLLQQAFAWAIAGLGTIP